LALRLGHYQVDTSLCRAAAANAPASSAAAVAVFYPASSAVAAAAAEAAAQRWLEALGRAVATAEAMYCAGGSRKYWPRSSVSGGASRGHCEGGGGGVNAEAEGGPSGAVTEADEGLGAGPLDAGWAAAAGRAACAAFEFEQCLGSSHIE
jgi:hypothetical protein